MKISAFRIFVLTIFLLCQFLSISRMFYLHFWGKHMMFVFTGLCYGSMFLLPVIVLLYLKDKNRTIVNSITKTLTYFLTFILLFYTCYGLYLGNPLNYIAFDFSTLFCIISFFILGTQLQFWKDIIVLGFVFHLLAVLLNIWGSFIIVDKEYFDIMMNADKNNRVALLFLSYQTQFTLNFWPLLVMKWKDLTNFKKYFILFSVIFIVIQQIIFQKRAPIGRIIAYLSFYIFSNNYYKIFPLRKVILKGFFIFIFFGFVSLSYIYIKYNNNFIFNQVIGLADRFVKPNYESDKVGIISFERFEEVRIMLSSFDWYEHFLGRGFGGYYEDYTKFYAFTRSLETGLYTSQSPHIGIADSYLKGGSILFIFYNFFYIIPILTYKYNRNDINHSLSFIVVLLSYFFLFIEGFHSFTSSTFQIVVTNMSIGYMYNNIK